MDWETAMFILHVLARRGVMSVAEGLKLPWHIVWRQSQILVENK